MKKIITRLSSNIVKKQRMELTIRTPYQTIIESFSGFQNLSAKTTDSVLLVQNRMPPALHLLPPGKLTVKVLENVEGFSGNIMHTGGWLVIGADNTCEINLLEAVESKDVEINKVSQADIDQLPSENLFVNKIRNGSQKSWAKKMA